MKKALHFIILIFLANNVNGQVNLDLEGWTDQGTYHTPDNWGTYNPFVTWFGFPVTVYKETTSPAEGNAAAKITTVDCPQCPNYGWNDTLSGTLQQVFPLTGTSNSLTFSYKYRSSGSDKGGALIQYHHWDGAMGQRVIDREAYLSLDPAITWTPMSVQAIDITGQSSDSVTIEFNSSVGMMLDDQSIAPTSFGSELSIDQVAITNAITNIVNSEVEDVKIYAHGNVIFIRNPNNSKTGTIEVTNLFGQVILSENVNAPSHNFETDVASGIYVVSIKFNENHIVTQKVMITK